MVLEHTTDEVVWLHQSASVATRVSTVVEEASLHHPVVRVSTGHHADQLLGAGLACLNTQLQQSTGACIQLGILQRFLDGVLLHVGYVKPTLSEHLNHLGHLCSLQATSSSSHTPSDVFFQ